MVVRYRGTGTQSGELLGVTPSKKSIDLSGTQWARIVDGKIVENWHYWNLSYVVRTLLEEVKMLRTIIPLCSFCKKVRDEKGYWEQVDVYLEKYTQADVSHSLCLECMKREYPEIYADMDREE